MKKIYGVALGIIVLLLGAGCFFNQSAAAGATPVSANGRLQVKGGRIVNAKGKPFVIKGVSTHGLSWYPQYVNKVHSLL